MVLVWHLPKCARCWHGIITCIPYVYGVRALEVVEAQLPGLKGISRLYRKGIAQTLLPSSNLDRGKAVKRPNGGAQTSIELI